MTIDQDQTTTNDGAQNSADQTTSDQSSDQSSSTTTEDQSQQGDDQDRVDLGTGKDKVEDEQKLPEDTRTEEQKTADAAAEAERAKLFGAPEEGKPYEITGLPDGMGIDTKALEAITPIARKLDLSNEGMSEFARVYATEVLPGIAQQVVDGLNADAVAKRKGWEDEARDLIAGKAEPLATATGDKIDFGGRSLPEVQKIAAKALDKVAPAGFREWLDETGLGVHPQMIAFAYQIGKDIAEDREHEPADHSRKQPAGGGRPMTDASKYYDRA
jgi:hypothetical protein